jgi:antitoxin (DNA-binding transcriptional repressor) of toxin-antitoxin stability system
MDTLTTKQMRENMPEVIRLLDSGRPVRLTYRHKTIGTIQPAPAAAPPRRGSAEAVRQGLAALKDLHVPDEVKNDPRNIKEQIAELRDRKYGR